MDKLVVFFVIVGVIFVLSLIFSLPVMWMWNGCLVPAVTFAKPISWLQALGISILSNILFKSHNSSIKE